MFVEKILDKKNWLQLKITFENKTTLRRFLIFLFEEEILEILWN